MSDLKQQYQLSLKVFRIIVKWFDTLENKADRDYIIELLNQRNNEKGN